MCIFAGPRRAGAVALLALVVPSLFQGACAQSEARVLCHTTYGGETRTLRISPVASPYAVKAIDIGSFFHFRVVFQNTPADGAAVKVYTYADRDDGPQLVHQASWVYPPAVPAGSPDGFTGRQSVYEPVRDGELQYWCAIGSAGEGA